ncbi:hypothetical protein [Marinigracilibium pacificum]|uniref:Peptidase M48 domain-containing protein n=1 Tax=Marinigracilibium pacificum TaxID=2729599 RepID=A0A848J2Z9_9BACT|nr:hypothetical protein [Marinigracilibium pacificum]NMM50101.1 hypothetical protein [Marinigracilibium pacificum]
MKINYSAKYILLLFFLINQSGICLAQNSDSIRVMAGKNIPERIKDQVYETLQFYPELIDTKIDFVFTKNIRKSFMQAQPNIKDIFKRKENRSYKVKITPELQLTNGSIPVEELPHDVLIGWLAHELGHIMDYKDRSCINMLGFGLSYTLNKTFLMSSEQTADIYAINHGLGRMVKKTKEFILTRSDIPEDYRERIRELYLSPEEVMVIIEKENDITTD